MLFDYRGGTGTMADNRETQMPLLALQEAVIQPTVDATPEPTEWPTTSRLRRLLHPATRCCSANTSRQHAGAASHTLRHIFSSVPIPVAHECGGGGCGAGGDSLS